MTELELYKFVQDKEIAWRGDKLILWLDFDDINEFTKLVGYSYIADNAIDVRLKEDCIAIELSDICNEYDIEPTHILARDD